MKRYAVKSLESWKNSVGRKPLLLSGARQVGKTWLVRDFAARHYDNLIELNLLYFKRQRRLIQCESAPQRFF